MAGTFHRLSLYLLALALAVTPLRGALALNTLSATASLHDCPHLRLDGHPPEHTAGCHGTHESGHDCSRGCSGSCCGSACTCAHVAAALTAYLRIPPYTPVAARHATDFQGFSQRSLPPPFRPPVSA